MSIEYSRFTPAVTGPWGEEKRQLKWSTISSLSFKSVALWLCTSPNYYPALARYWSSRRTILGCIIEKVLIMENRLLSMFPDKNLDLYRNLYSVQFMWAYGRQEANAINKKISQGKICCFEDKSILSFIINSIPFCNWA